MMKKIIFAFLSLGFITDANAGILHCYDVARVGFKRDLGMKVTRFKPKKFTIEVDFENYMIYGEEIKLPKRLKHTEKCWTLNWGSEETLSCAVRLGATFELNLKTLHYSRAYYLSFGDNNWIGHGKCEKY